MPPQLSQIIFFVVKNSYNKDIWSFRTKNKNNLEKIRFTYLDYSSTNGQISYEKLFDFLESKIMCKRENTLIISDDSNILREANSKKLPTVALISSGEEHIFGSEYCVSDIGELAFDIILKIWQRQVGLPWEIVKTERLIIREQMLEDLPYIYEMYADPDTTLYMEAINKDLNQEKRYMEEYISNQYRFFEYGLWTLIDRRTGEYIGRAGLSNREGYEEVELGYVISSKYRHMGFAKEACLAIIDYAKNELELASLIAFVHEENQASISLLKQLGFTRSFNRLCIGDNVKICDMYRKYFDI